ncbi:hypothetical protein CBR_g56896 [Chara braunii]|uniref:Protein DETOXIFICATION n=1 Tax=Chara braunii TaxID=69332 RepID=A0A388MDU6_CHABU|nr:hypothetical protein CBR_g56896 [Chara braunii]|eukprot:GBG92734.1 hypothetical protein CBR_g56896 [Chara braunii]
MATQKLSACVFTSALVHQACVFTSSLVYRGRFIEWRRDIHSTCENGYDCSLRLRRAVQRRHGGHFVNDFLARSCKKACESATRTYLSFPITVGAFTVIHLTEPLWGKLSKPRGVKNMGAPGTNGVADDHHGMTSMAGDAVAPLNGVIVTRTNFGVKPTAGKHDGNSHGACILENWEFQQSPELPRFLPTLRGHHMGQLTGADSSEILLEFKRCLALAAPTALANILWFARVVVSTIYLGHLGNNDLAGAALAMGFCNVTGYSLVMGLSTGIDPICAQAYGAGNYKLLQLTMQRAVIMLQCVSAVIAVSIWLNVERILILCGQDPEIAAVTKNYTLVLIPDLFVYALVVPTRTYLRSQYITVPLTVSAGIALCIHIPLNYALIFKAGLGYRGAALSTVCTDISFICLLLLTVWLVTPKEGRGKWEGWSRECLKEWGPILRLSLPSCVSVCVEWWTFEIITIFAGLLPDPSTAVATMSIMLNCAYMSIMTPLAVSQSASTRVGIELGANSPPAARLAAYVAWSIAFVLAGASLTFFTTCGAHVARLFTDIASVQLHIQTVIPLLGIVQLFSIPQSVAAGIVRGCARPDALLGVSLVAFYLIGLPLAAYLAFVMHMGDAGLWRGLIAAEVVAAVSTVSIILLLDWGAEAKRAQLFVTKSQCSATIPHDDDPHVDSAETGKKDPTNDCPQKWAGTDYHNIADQSLTAPLLNDQEEDSACEDSKPAGNRLDTSH